MNLDQYKDCRRFLRIYTFKHVISHICIKYKAVYNIYFYQEKEKEKRRNTKLMKEMNSVEAVVTKTIVVIFFNYSILQFKCWLV